MHWKETWTDTALHGYRPGRRAEDVWMDLSLFVESALVDGSDLVVSIDWSKCSPSSSLRGKALHPRMLQPLRGMYRDWRRRFVMAGHVAKEFAVRESVCPMYHTCAQSARDDVTLLHRKFIVNRPRQPTTHVCEKLPSHTQGLEQCGHVLSRHPLLRCRPFHRSQ